MEKKKKLPSDKNGGGSVKVEGRCVRTMCVFTNLPVHTAAAASVTVTGWLAGFTLPP